MINRLNLSFSKKKRYSLQEMMLQIGIIFSRVSYWSFDKDMSLAFSKLSEYLEIDRIYFVRYLWEVQQFSTYIEYASDGVASFWKSIGKKPLSILGNLPDIHQDGEDLILNLGKSCPANQIFLDIVNHSRCQQIYTIPVFRENQLLGYMGFDSIWRMFSQKKKDVQIIKEFAQLFSVVVSRIEHEGSIQAEKERSIRIMESANVASWEYHLGSHQLIVNQKWFELIGYHRSEFENITLDTWKSLVHPEDIEEAIYQLNRLIHQETLIYQMNFRMLHKDGSYRWFQSTGRFYQDNSNSGIILGAQVEITKLKLEEEYLKVITKAVDQSPSGVMITNAQTEIEYVNPYFEKMTGYQKEEVLGKNPHILKSGHHDSNFYQGLYQTIQSGNLWRGTFINQRKNGLIYYEDASISAVFNDCNEISHYIAIKTDVTQKRMIEDQLDVRRQELEEEVTLKISEIEESQQSAIIALTKLTEERDSDTGMHVERVQNLSKALTLQLRKHQQYLSRIDSKFIRDIYYASALHDIGKIKIPDAILLKPGKLTSEEFDIIKKHVIYGESILSEMIRFYPKSNLVSMGKVIAKTHHEKWDGSGYPDQLQGDTIPLPGRIMALVDVYDALRSKRPYKRAYSHEEAKSLILEQSNKHFDPNIVEAFHEIHDQFDEIFNAFR